MEQGASALCCLAQGGWPGNRQDSTCLALPFSDSKSLLQCPFGHISHWPQHLQLDRHTVIYTESADLQSRSDSGSKYIGDVQQVSNAATVAQAAAEIAGGSKASPLGSKASPLGSRGSGMAGALNRALGSAKKAVGAASWRRSHAG